MVLLNLNNTNISCSFSMRWSQSNINSRQWILIVCIVASIMHGIFWLQLVFCSSVRQKSMQWIYAYLVTDIFLLFRFFFIYIVHTTSNDCIPNEIWTLFMCYFEATVGNYLSILEVYILLALNICRYVQIAYNRNVYTKDVILLLLVHLTIYLLPLISLTVQFMSGWAQIEYYIDDVCGVRYTNIYVQIFNIITGFALPIILNVLMIAASVRHIHLTSGLKNARHHVSVLEKYHHSLTIQFLYFYIIWLVLWSPNIIIHQFTSGRTVVTIMARLINIFEIALDPIIISALDVRFWHAWKKLWLNFKNEYLKCLQAHKRQIRPIVVNPAI